MTPPTNKVITALRRDRDYLNEIREENGGLDPDHLTMRWRFRTWKRLRAAERDRNREAMKAMRRTSVPSCTIRHVPASYRPERMIPKGGPRNLWRTFPPR